MPRIELNLIDGDYFNAAHVNAIEAAINESSMAGDVKMTVAGVAGTGWIFLLGQTVTNFQGLYPEAWNAIPTAWKSGSNANLPNMEQRFPVGAKAGVWNVGTIGGSMAKTLVAANLPPHAHSMDHDHGAVLSGGRTLAHTHYMGTYALFNVAGGLFVQNAASGYNYTTPGYDTGTESSDHQHWVDLPNFTGNTGPGPGSASAIDITPSYLAVNFALRVY